MGGYIAEHWGWRATFYVFGGCGIFWGFVLAARLKNSPREVVGDGFATGEKVTLGQALTVLFRSSTARYLTVGFTAIVFVNNAYVVWAPSFVEEKFQLSLTAAGGGAMLYHHLAALISILIGGRISDAMVRRRCGFRLELQAGAMLLGVPAILWMGLADSVTATWTAMAALGICRGLYEANTQASLFDVISPRFRASAFAMMVMVAFLAGSTSPWLLGLCREAFNDGHGLSYGFAAMSAVYLIGGLAVAIALKTTFHRDFLDDRVDVSSPLS